MGAPRSTGGFIVHRDDIDRLAAYVDEITPVGPAVSQSPTRKGRYIVFPPPPAVPPALSPNAAMPIRPLSILDASNEDNPARVRVVNGTLGGLLPEEMNFPDGVQSNGTDNSCYLTMSSGTNYVYGKVLVDSNTGLYSSASVYAVTTQEDPDDTYAYLLIGTVQYDGSAGSLAIAQNVTGSQSLAVACSADGTILQPLWGFGDF